MRLAWELTINAVEVWIIYDFLVRYFGYRASGAAKYAGTVLCVGMAFAVISAISYVVPFETISTILMVGISFVFCLCLLKGNIFEKAFISAFIMLVVMLIAVTTAFLFSYMRGTEIIFIFSVLDPIRMIAMVTTKLLLFAFTRLILYLRHGAELSFSEFLPLILTPVFSLAAITILMPTALKNDEITNQSFTVIAIIIVMNMLIYYLFLRTSRSNRMKQDYALLQLQYTGEQKRAEETRQLYEEIRGIRHDMKNHLLCIQILAEQGKYEGICDYIQGFSGKSGEQDRTVFYTGNDILDAILNTKMSIAEQEGGIRCTVEISCGEIPLSQNDLSVLMGNLMDNACEAAKLSEEKELGIKIISQKNHLSICVYNTTAAPVLEKNPELKTSKKDKSVHGLGTRNIRKITAKYEGIIEYHENERFFFCDILIPFDTKHVL